VIWMFVVAVIAAGTVASLFAMGRVRRGIPGVLEALDRFGREMQPAVVRVRSAAEELRDR
jgi:hypothetical protein